MNCECFFFCAACVVFFWESVFSGAGLCVVGGCRKWSASSSGNNCEKIEENPAHMCVGTNCFEQVFEKHPLLHVQIKLNEIY